MAYEVLKTTEFDEWLAAQQPKIRVLVLARLDMVALGHFGNHKRFEWLIELKWLNGTRVYTFLWGSAVVIALNGGSKHAQNRDIKHAKKIRDQVLDGSRTIRK